MSETPSIRNARVDSVPDHTLGDENIHHVKVTDDFGDGVEYAYAPVGLVGDVQLPKEGQKVKVLETATESIILCSAYDSTEEPPAYTEDERVITHPNGDAEVQFNSDGSIGINGDTDVRINGGGDRPIVDIGLQRDADGHVTDVIPQYASNVYL